MKGCPNCKSEIPEEAKFCPKCGVSLNAETLRMRFGQSDVTISPSISVSPCISVGREDIGYQSKTGRDLEEKIEELKARIKDVNPGIEARLEGPDLKNGKAPPHFPPELLKSYSSPELIGTGGFASVFRAIRRNDGKLIAVKIPKDVDSATGKSFLKEIRIWEKLKHRYIVDLYDVNILPLLYLEMEYMAGGSLEKLAKPLPAEQSAGLVLQLAEALEYAHSKGVIHRDIKPGNVLLSSESVPKLTDWGLAKIKADSKASTEAFFSPLYAAPEQISPAKFGKPDERTDIYQLGTVFYELLTGKTPFAGDDITSLGMVILLEEAESVSRLNPEGLAFEGIIMKCLAKHKEERYRDATELLQTLRKHLKETYCVALKDSAGNLKRSVYYCAQLFLLHVRLNEVVEALKYCADLKNYARGHSKNEVDNLAQELEFRLTEGVQIGEEFISKAELIAHQIQMGWA